MMASRLVCRGNAGLTSHPSEQRGTHRGDHCEVTISRSRAALDNAGRGQTSEIDRSEKDREEAIKHDDHENRFDD